MPKYAEDRDTSSAQLEEYRLVVTHCIADLDDLAAVRVGQMDSESRAIEITQRIKSTVAAVADRLRTLG